MIIFAAEYATFSMNFRPTEEMKFGQLRKLLRFYLYIRNIFATFAPDKTHWRCLREEEKSIIIPQNIKIILGSDGCQLLHIKLDILHIRAL